MHTNNSDVNFEKIQKANKEFINDMNQMINRDNHIELFWRTYEALKNNPESFHEEILDYYKRILRMLLRLNGDDFPAISKIFENKLNKIKRGKPNDCKDIMKRILDSLSAN